MRASNDTNVLVRGGRYFYRWPRTSRGGNGSSNFPVDTIPLNHHIRVPLCIEYFDLSFVGRLTNSMQALRGGSDIRVNRPAPELNHRRLAVSSWLK